MRTAGWWKALWLAALLPLFAASVLATQLRTLVCRFTGAVMEGGTCCPVDPDPQAHTGVFCRAAPRATFARLVQHRPVLRWSC
jgi:hypothetical protein